MNIFIDNGFRMRVTKLYEMRDKLSKRLQTSIVLPYDTVDTCVMQLYAYVRRYANTIEQKWTFGITVMVQCCIAFCVYCMSCEIDPNRNCCIRKFHCILRYLFEYCMTVLCKFTNEYNVLLSKLLLFREYLQNQIIWFQNT